MTDSGDWRMNAVLAADAEVRERAGLVRMLRASQARRGAALIIDGRPVRDFSSNDYLGLASDVRIAAAAAAALEGSAIGAAAARLVSGNHPLHQELEADLARFKGSESALLFSSGYTANIGAIPALVGKRDVIYADELNHASLIDACRLSRAEVRVLPHNDITALRAALQSDGTTFRRRLIVVDSVFSMDGDLYPLDELVRTAREFHAWTYVDDAHGTGVLGDGGRGAAEQWNVEGELDVVMGTLGKALGVSGAFIAGSRTVVNHLMHRARSFVYTTGTPPHLAAACIEALRIAVGEPWRRAALRKNARQLRESLANLGLLTPGERDGHIVPVVLNDAARTMRCGAALLERGFAVGAIRPPTVALGQSRLRITVSAVHSPDDIEELVEALREVLTLEVVTT